MNYYVIEIATGDTKIAGKGIYEFATLEEAVASWHKKLGTAMSSKMYTSELCMVIDSNGTVYNAESFAREGE